MRRRPANGVRSSRTWWRRAGSLVCWRTRGTGRSAGVRSARVTGTHGSCHRVLGSTDRSTMRRRGWSAASTSHVRNAVLGWPRSCWLRPSPTWSGREEPWSRGIRLTTKRRQPGRQGCSSARSRCSGPPASRRLPAETVVLSSGSGCNREPENATWSTAVMGAHEAVATALRIADATAAATTSLPAAER